MSGALLLALASLALAPALAAQVDPVAVRVPEAEAWIGQRVPVFVELRAPGSFAGTASFDLPRLPGTFLLKVGTPVVSSEEREGTSWFVQTHEFALFSQATGTLEVPAFEVRFAHREGFTGDPHDVRAEVPGWTLTLERPPGTDALGFIVTTESLDVTETWSPARGSVEAGALLERTIVQRAPEVSGMALAPAPTAAPDGVRVYPGEARVRDELERGAFLGERSETLTYLLTEPGSVTLPALTYAWWDPAAKELRSKTLPAVTLDVTAAPGATAPGATRGAPRSRSWPWLLALAALGGLCVWRAQRIASWARRVARRLKPPMRVAARRLLKACAAHDAVAAESAWGTWRRLQGASFQFDPTLRGAVLGLQRARFGPTAPMSWRGDELSAAFRRALAGARTRRSRASEPALPALNAGDGGR